MDNTSLANRLSKEFCISVEEANRYINLYLESLSVDGGISLLQEELYRRLCVVIPQILNA